MYIYTCIYSCVYARICLPLTNLLRDCVDGDDDDVAAHSMLNMATVLSHLGRNRDAVIAAKRAVQLAEGRPGIAHRY